MSRFQSEMAGNPTTQAAEQEPPGEAIVAVIVVQRGAGRAPQWVTDLDAKGEAPEQQARTLVFRIARVEVEELAGQACAELDESSAQIAVEV